MTKYSLTPGAIVERIGDDLMVVVPGQTDVVSLSGRPADVLLRLAAGTGVDPSEPALRDLIQLGIISAPGLSRRGLIRAGAVGAGAGIAVLAMPSVAAASSDASSNTIIPLTQFGPSFGNPQVFDFRAVPPTFDNTEDLSLVVPTVESSSVTLSNGDTLTNAVAFNGWAAGIIFRLQTNVPESTPVNVVAAEVKFIFKGILWTARFEDSAP